MLANNLSGQHLDEEIQFDWEFPNSYVKATITGVLREIHHAHNEVILELAGIDSLGDKQEFILNPDEEVLVL